MKHNGYQIVNELFGFGEEASESVVNYFMDGAISHVINQYNKNHTVENVAFCFGKDKNIIVAYTHKTLFNINIVRDIFDSKSDIHVVVTTGMVSIDPDDFSDVKLDDPKLEGFYKNIKDKAISVSGYSKHHHIGTCYITINKNNKPGVFVFETRKHNTFKIVNQINSNQSTKLYNNTSSRKVI